MSFKGFLKQCIVEYFIITTLVTAAIAILGLILDPTATIGYEGFFSPLIFGFISIMPSLVMYSHKELSFKQMLFRKILHLILLECMLLLFSFYAGIVRNSAEGASFALTVFIVYLGVNLISWQLDKKEADEINNNLRYIQDRNE